MRIRRIREGLGLSQKYVATEVGISPSTLCRVEGGKQPLLYRLAIHLALVLDCDLGAFDDALGGPLRNVVPGRFRKRPDEGDGPSTSPA